ncbi:glycosyl hydrolase [Crepidotus variabilis]|uniref:Glycosyl hydrolase n=1 Tax=Crepidotus variabilis TaxID=179855 RepID=A0A9P6EK68_9AGAR|nr:glycosyl hydrolase [Crepidotus variabilis]
MIRSSTIALAAFTVTLVQNVAGAGADNSLFLKWRTRSRFIAPAGWMNDPNGAMYDPEKDEYHLFYQWLPNHVFSTDNKSWGHAVSRDLITWTDVAHHGTPAWQNANAEALAPAGGNGSYNSIGIWSGTAAPVSINGTHALVAFYTSISVLPVPHPPSGETQSFAISKDNGQTWNNYEGNPVIKTSPEGWDITGFRDPFFEAWPEMDQVLQQQEPHYYLSVGGGIKSVGSRIMFYSAPVSDITKWTFLGPLWEPQVGDSPGPNGGDWGYNFEMPNFFSLKDQEGTTRYYLGMGAVAGNLYSEGTVSQREDGGLAFKPISGSRFDAGQLYALTSFIDTKHNNRRFQWGWLPEDFPAEYIPQQGSQGVFALPREIFALVTKNLLDPDGKLKNSGAYVTKQDDGKFQASVLGVKPLPDVLEGLRKGAAFAKFDQVVVPASVSHILSTNTTAHTVEISASFPSSIKGGVIVAASPNKEEYTTVYYDPRSNEIIVDRNHSTTLENFNKSEIKGYFLPYTTASGTEDINLRVFVDGSILEVYANDRFSLTARIYPDRADSVAFGLFNGDGKGAKFSNIQTWVGTGNIWPDRPVNCSSPLL